MIVARLIWIATAIMASVAIALAIREKRRLEKARDAWFTRLSKTACAMIDLIATGDKDPTKWRSIVRECDALDEEANKLYPTGDSRPDFMLSLVRKAIGNTGPAWSV